MANINDILVQASELRAGIDRLLRSSTYRQYDDLSGLEINRQDSEQLFLLDELRGIMEKLDNVEEAIRYLELPVDEISHLHKNDSDRYETRRVRCSAAATPLRLLSPTTAMTFPIGRGPEWSMTAPAITWWATVILP